MQKNFSRFDKRIWKKYNRRNFCKSVINFGLAKIKLSNKAIISKYENELDLYATQEKIKEFILASKPALIARFGSNEARCTAEAIGIRLRAKKHFREKTSLLINRNAGVFPKTEEFLMRYGEISERSARNIDLLGEWSSYMQDYLVKNICKKDVLLTKLKNLEPYYSTNPWTSALKGKKVLVIHPFKETIESQYKKRKLLFKDEDFLPDFDLKVLKAVQTIANVKDARFNTWEEALNYMFEEACKIDFDVAIIGCGAYGMPLASMLKDAGKVAIHLGGATQILFGIKGNRWETHPVISKLFNEHWVRPNERETPSSASNIENSCYW